MSFLFYVGYGNGTGSSEAKASGSMTREWFMTRSSYNNRECECGAGVPPAGDDDQPPRGARTGVVRSCSVGLVYYKFNLV